MTCLLLRQCLCCVFMCMLDAIYIKLLSRKLQVLFPNYTYTVCIWFVHLVQPKFNWCFWLQFATIAIFLLDCLSIGKKRQKSVVHFGKIPRIFANGRWIRWGNLSGRTSEHNIQLFIGPNEADRFFLGYAGQHAAKAWLHCCRLFTHILRLFFGIGCRSEPAHPLYGMPHVDDGHTAQHSWCVLQRWQVQQLHKIPEHRLHRSTVPYHL